MSFFHEPPPLDSDIPPPLDDKLRDNDFDLDDEEAVEERNFDLPELPTDYKVFGSVAVDENLSYTHPPPELPSFVFESSPPPDDLQFETKDSDQSESPETCDVAKEKESETIATVAVSQLQPPQEAVAGGDKELDELSSFPSQGDTEIEKVSTVVSDDVSDEEKLNTAAVSNDEDENIPCEKNGKIVETNLHSKSSDDEQKEVEECRISDNSIVDDDDDFDDFVEAAPIPVQSVISDAFKTTQLQASEEFDDFTGFTSHADIPEPIPELNFEDGDDDDFDDFETAIPANRQIENVGTFSTGESNDVEAVQFEADFSAFNAFSEPVENSSFDDFQDFKAAGFDSDRTEQETQNEDDDDDFGDFSDFTQAPVPIAIQPAQPEVQPFNLVKPANVAGIFEMMFPPTSSCSDVKPLALEAEISRDQQIIKSDTFVNKFNDFDSTLALGYQYSSSKSSQILVKALGIDTRNIMLGPQWNSSSASSNMPRFAANLSFSPIEPMKPSLTKTSTSVKSSTEPKPSILQPTKAPSEIVPEAEFDWNSSGLTNPLDGPQPKSKQPHDVEPVNAIQQPAVPPTHSFENESSLNVMDQEVTQVLEAETKANASHKPELSEPASAYQWSSEHHIGHFSSSGNSSILVRERTIKLPETHIFTPVKGTSPVAREVVSRETSPAPQDDAYFPKGPITVKEYHDVEYSLEPKKRNESDAEFDDFQSAQPAVVKSEPPLVPLNLLEPQKIPSSSTEIKWPEPGNVAASIDNELDFLEKPAVEQPKLSFNLPLAPQGSTIVVKKKDFEYSKPVIGTSPTEQNGTVEEDDFNDFQAAPAPAQVKVAAPLPQPVKKPSNDPITLSPARLVATANKPSSQKSSWISSFDNDEISRIEAAFPKCKTEKKATNDDDEWSDFVGAGQPSSLPFTQSQPPSMISSNSFTISSKVSNGEVDDWSDFVSVPPKIPPSKSSGAISSQFQSKPNFSSWNHPMSKPYVNHTTSFLTNNPAGQQQFMSNNYTFVAEKVPRNAMNITNNFSYGFNQPKIYQGTGAPANHHQQPKPNGISTILPELDFAMPKNLINLPRGGQIDPGKK